MNSALFFLKRSKSCYNFADFADLSDDLPGQSDDLLRSVCKNIVVPFSLFLQQMDGVKYKK